MNCANCSHFHQYPDKLFCDAGVMEVILVGKPVIEGVSMPECVRFDALVPVDYEIPVVKIDKRTKKYRAGKA